MEERIALTIDEMADVLNLAQLRKLQEVLVKNFTDNMNSKSEIATAN